MRSSTSPPPTPIPSLIHLSQAREIFTELQKPEVAIPVIATAALGSAALLNYHSTLRVRSVHGTLKAECWNLTACETYG